MVEMWVLFKLEALVKDEMPDQERKVGKLGRNWRC